MRKKTEISFLALKDNRGDGGQKIWLPRDKTLLVNLSNMGYLYESYL